MVKVYVDATDSKPTSWAFVDRDATEFEVRLDNEYQLTDLYENGQLRISLYRDDIPLLIKALSAAYEAGGSDVD